jgi:hypothetical protein
MVFFRGQLPTAARCVWPRITSIANFTSTLDWVQNLNLTCDWPFVKICQTGLGN